LLCRRRLLFDRPGASTPQRGVVIPKRPLHW
jgi:hypothetical protein